LIVWKCEKKASLYLVEEKAMIRVLAKALAATAAVLAIQTILIAGVCSAQSPDAGTPKINTYYVAADEVEWNYAPSGINKMMGMKFEGYETVFTERGLTASAQPIEKPSIANTPTRHLQRSSRALRNGNISDF
jgi:hypothetical protein